MAYPEHIIRRAIELKKGSSAGAVLRELEKEFPGEVASLNVRTIIRWEKTKSAALVEPPVPIEKEQGKIPLISRESLKEHDERLAEIANSLLDNDLDSVLHGWSTNRVAGQVMYILTKKDKVGDYYHLSEQQLSERVKENIVLAEHKYERWFFHDCFLPHLKSELPEELKTKGFFDVVKEQPYELVEILRVLAARKTFKGTCPVCRDWVS